jgi:hypothetical protein
MRLPTQATPISRSVTAAPLRRAVLPSGIACTLCHAACDRIGDSTLRAACNLACDNTVC